MGTENSFEGMARWFKAFRKTCYFGLSGALVLFGLYSLCKLEYKQVRNPTSFTKILDASGNLFYTEDTNRDGKIDVIYSSEGYNLYPIRAAKEYDNLRKPRTKWTKEMSPKLQDLTTRLIKLQEEFSEEILK